MQENNPNEEPQSEDGVEEKPDLENIDSVNDEGLQTLVEWAIGGFIGLCVVGLVLALIPATQQIRGPHLQTTCLNQIRQISLAMQNYAASNMHFPPAYIADETGKPMHSWRVLILPYIEQKALYDQYSFDEPWNGPNNSKLHDIIVPGFQCPSAHRSEQGFNSSYMLMTGKGTAFDGDNETAFPDIADGSSNTVMIVEVANSDTHWMEPVDISLDEALARFTDKSKVKDCCNHAGTINVSLMDGSTHVIDLPVSPKDLKAIATIDGGEIVDINDL